MAASETIVFAVEVDASQATRTLEEVRLEFQRLQKELDKLTPGTEAFGKTLNELGKTKKVLADVATETRKATDAATEYTIENAKTVGQLKQVQKALLAQIQDVEKGSEAYEKLAADLKFANVQLSNFRKDTAAGPFLRDQFAEQTNAIKEFRAEVSKGFGDIGGSISKIGASFGSFLVAQVAVDAIINIGKAALETVKEVEVLRNQLNLLFTETGAAQDALLVEAQTISKTFGVDAQEAIRAANVLQEQFGITAADSFKLLRDGFVSGANAGGDFLSTVTEYSTQLKAAGVTLTTSLPSLARPRRRACFRTRGSTWLRSLGCVSESKPPEQRTR
jgi:chromosome segregation ATPase